MNKSFTTLALTAVLAFGGFALATVDASAQRVGGKSSTGPSSPGGDGGGPGGDQPLIIARTDCPPTVAATACNNPKLRKPVVAERLRCSTWDYPRIVLPSGFIIVDYNAEKVKYCGDKTAM